MNRIAAVLLAVAIAPAIGCRSPAGDPSRIWGEDFETACDGTPCGWEQIDGPEGAVRWVETIPGDHGLELTGDVTVASAPAMAMGNSGSFLSMRATARCDSGSRLEVRVSIVDTSESRVSLDGTLRPPATWETATDPALLSPDLTLTTGSVDRIGGVAVRKTGPGKCEIDRLALRIGI